MSVFDQRKKGCPNIRCIRNKKKELIKPSDYFCSHCGTRLVFVCTNCFCIIDSPNPKSKLCAKCTTEAEEKKKQSKEETKQLIDSTIDLAGAVTGFVVDKKVEDVKNAIVDAGVDTVKRIVFKK